MELSMEMEKWEDRTEEYSGIFNPIVTQRNNIVWYVRVPCFH